MPVAIQRPQLLQGLHGGVPCPFRRQVQPFEGARIVHPPTGEVEDEIAQFCFEDLRPVLFGHGGILALMPQADRHAGLGASGASGPLGHGIPRGTYRLQPGQAGCRFMARYTGKAAVDDYPHAIQRQ